MTQGGGRDRKLMGGKDGETHKGRGAEIHTEGNGETYIFFFTEEQKEGTWGFLLEIKRCQKTWYPAKSDVVQLDSYDDMRLWVMSTHYCLTQHTQHKIT